jgi:hypothetical protein
MKLFLKDLAVFVCSYLVMFVAFIGALVAAQTKLELWYIWVPALLLSWLIFVPTYLYWRDVFTALFNRNDDSDPA